MADNGGLIPFVGTWDSGTFYLRGSCVLRSGILYQARTDRGDGRDPTNGAAYWDNMTSVVVTLTGSIDPAAGGGVPAALGSTYQQSGVGLLVKTDSGATDWAAPGGGGSGVTVDNTVDAPFAATTLLIPGASESGAGEATLPTVVVSPDDPGAIGAGNLWLQSNAGEGGDDYYQLNVRNDTDDGWFGAGPITNTDRETYVTIASPDDSVELQIQNDGQGPSTISGDFGAQSFQVANGATISTGAAAPTAGAGVVASVGSVYLQTDGSFWAKTDAGDTAWTQVFGAASLQDYNASAGIGLSTTSSDITIDSGEDLLLIVAGAFTVSGLPSADPEVAGQLYTDGVVSAGTPQPLMVSGGPA